MIEHKMRPGDFNGLAANYQRYRIGYSSELFDALETLGVHRGAHVLDVGCGTGIATAPLAARGMKVTGLDPSSEMLALARVALPDATFVEGRVEALPFADRTFDAAVSAQSFHWFDADKAYAELTRVVKSGGPIGVWWKVLSSDDALRAARAVACEQAGVAAARDPLQGGFTAFYRAPFADRALRVLPFGARLSIDDWIGYERSRAFARNEYGAKCDAYIDALRAELIRRHGSPAARIEVRYTQYLYVGKSAH